MKRTISCHFENTQFMGKGFHRAHWFDYRINKLLIGTWVEGFASPTTDYPYWGEGES